MVKMIRSTVSHRLRIIAGITTGLLTLSGAYLAGPAHADSAAAAKARATPLVAGTPCTITAKSCVDLDSRRAWLFDHGTIIRGPVPISSGGRGEQTPIGHSLRVYRKDEHHTTTEFPLPNGQPAPMPYSVFFADGGIAFHGGDPKKASAGCIHLPLADAKAWFRYLRIGDQVQVVRASQERRARATTPTDHRDRETRDTSG